MTEPVIQERFGVGKFITKPEAPILHFKPDPMTGRDQYGNRLFTSKTSAYFDRESNPVKAGILISPEGDTFLKSHPGILNAIDRALVASQKDDDPDTVYELGKHGTLRFLSEGNQSMVYRLDTKEGSYVIKTPTSRFSDIGQPYINEMLQIQAITKEEEHTLRSIDARLPEVLFASGQISCMKMEEGRHPTDYEMSESTAAAILFTLVKNYIVEQQKADVPLWRNIYPDFEDRLNGSYRRENFIKTKDGTFVWIDPFLYEGNFTEEDFRAFRRAHF